MRAQIKTHTVDAKRVAGILPLRSHGQLMSPDRGLVLILGNDVQHVWLGEGGGIAPEVGDVLITDAELQTTYVVTAQKFSSFFSQVTEPSRTA